MPHAKIAVDEFPWLVPAWPTVAAGELHHGILITGPAGIAKREFAVSLSQAILCAAPVDFRPCNNCRNCKLFAAITHPDFHLLTTDADVLVRKLLLELPFLRPTFIARIRRKDGCRR